jgi:DNA-binding transcriptional LysR family regulator
MVIELKHLHCAAADALAPKQSNLSRKIRGLDEQLGVRLHRGHTSFGRSMALSERLRRTLRKRGSGTSAAATLEQAKPKWSAYNHTSGLNVVLWRRFGAPA